MSQQDIDAIAKGAEARRQALEFDDLDNRQRKFAEAMRAVAVLEPHRDRFIIECFTRGRSETSK
jgi:hypothetical protein